MTRQVARKCGRSVGSFFDQAIIQQALLSKPPVRGLKSLT